MNTKMKIEEHKIAVREVFDGYVDSAELGVRGYGGKHIHRRLTLFHPKGTRALSRSGSVLRVPSFGRNALSEGF